jgi:hypothetical protein
MKFFHDDMYRQAKAGPRPNLPPVVPVPNPQLPINQQSAFTNYRQWLLLVSASIQQATDLSQSPTYAQVARDARQEIVVFRRSISMFEFSNM